MVLQNRNTRQQNSCCISYGEKLGRNSYLRCTTQQVQDSCLPTMRSIIEYKKTPPMHTSEPMSFRGSKLSPSTMATPRMTTARFAVFATDCVTGPVFLIVMVASSL